MRNSSARIRPINDESKPNSVHSRMGARRIGLAVAEAAHESPAQATERPNSLSIPIWEPVAVSKAARVPTSSEVLHKTRTPNELRNDVEAQLTHTLTRPLAPDETHQTGAANRERELMAAIASLDVTQAFHLGRRFEIDRSDDPLAVAFRRFTVERRQRIRVFIADARRRAARVG